MTRDEAERLALAFQAREREGQALEMKLHLDLTRRFSLRWVIYILSYDSRHPGWPIPGSGPVLIDERNGSCHALGSAPSFFKQRIEEYERCWAESPPLTGAPFLDTKR